MIIQSKSSPCKVTGCTSRILREMTTGDYWKNVELENMDSILWKELMWQAVRKTAM